MNGFVKFEEVGRVDDFLSSPVAQAIDSRGSLVKSSTQPVVIFRELNKTDVRAVEDLAKSLGGKVVSSTQYRPL